MSTGIDAIYEELRRLQLEGVDHVFVRDATLDLVTSSARERPPPQGTPAKSARPGAAVDLKAAVAAETSKPAAPRQPQTSGTRPPADIKPLPTEPPKIDLPSGDPATQMGWLRERVEQCPTCNEHRGRDGKIVFGTGSVEADILFCGEAPGADEALSGEPFVGKAGQLLTKILQAMGLSRDSVYIANILKWRPEHDKPYGNRPPTPEEMNFCLPYLKAQIQIVRPKVIVALGNTAVSGLLGPDPRRKMGSIRGSWQNFEGIDTMITFHPSYLLRNNTLKTKRMVWEDMLQVMEKVGLPISEKQRGFFLPKQ